MSEKKESLEGQAKRVKGWCVQNGEPKICTHDVSLVIIHSLEEFVNFISSLDKFSKSNPIFYRGHYNANYIPLPTVMRSNIEYEDTLIKEFSRRFPKEVAAEKTTFERLALMQHFGLNTRALDITENPLVALAFACNRYPFSVSKETEDEECWGEIILFQESNNNDNHQTSDIKYTESQTTSIMANCALCPYEFYLGFLRICFLQDGHQGHSQNFIKFRDIVSQSIIVRSPFSNERQKNQRGAYILCNANEIVKITKNNSRSEPTGYDGNELTHKILTEEYNNFSLGDMKTLFADEFKRLEKSEEWDFKFRKIKPYSLENEIEHFRKDPFSLEHLYYKNSEGKKCAVLIPAECKKKIAKDLERFGLDNYFLYPDMQLVSQEINEMYI